MKLESGGVKVGSAIHPAKGGKTGMELVTVSVKGFDGNRLEKARLELFLCPIEPEEIIHSLKEIAAVYNFSSIAPAFRLRTELSSAMSSDAL